MRKRKKLKSIAIIVLLSIVWQLSFPIASYALTGGPSQPEVQGFEPIGTTQMVNLSSGDFVYNIPLLDVGGYPINISYHGGIGMDQEASWVGLGWDLNPGAINRSMRGLPDDFDGDMVKKTLKTRPNETFGLNLGVSAELIGLDKHAFGVTAGANMGVYYNTYKGVGYEASFKLGVESKCGASANLGIGFNSQSGINVDPALNFSFRMNKDENAETKIEGGIGVSAAYNSMAGVKSLTLSANESAKSHAKYKGTSGNMQDGGINVGSTISFANPGYTPQVQMSANNFSFSFNPSLGIEIYSLYPDFKMSGYYSAQFLAETERQLPGYGYLFADDGSKREDALMDFNREKEMPYFKNETPNLPVSNFTYDIYSISGQGTGGMFRPHRSDLPVLFDAENKTNDLPSGDLGVELGLAALFHAGVNVRPTFVYSRSGKWEGEDNDMSSGFEGRHGIGSSVSGISAAEGDNIELYEPFYFKQAGEKQADYSEFNSKLGGDAVVLPYIDDNGHLTNDYYYGQDSRPSSSPSTPQPSDYPIDRFAQANIVDALSLRDKRNEFISYLNAEEASRFALSPHICSYPSDTIMFVKSGETEPKTRPLNRLPINPSDCPAQKHHMSEVMVTNPDGTRYVYGIPAYNIKQVESSFSVDVKNVNCPKGLIKYDDGDDSPSNKKGEDNRFSSTEMPPFAHSYLLTSVLSPDYVDVKSDGITDDDLGTAIKVNYSRAYPTAAASGTDNTYYKWRIPYGHDTANYEEGFKSNPIDDKANYIYGEKEVYYVHSIESRDYVAQFYTSPRHDSYGVSGIAGDPDFNHPLQRLDCIKLYAKRDLLANGINAVPIKTVHFTYSYSLCPGIPNNDNRTQTGSPENIGKLTLTGISFEYGGSHKGMLNPYTFKYQGLNPHYNMKGYDRWGNYKPNVDCGGSQMTTSEFPYVQQTSNPDGTSAHDVNASYASSWSLTEIDLPSGGNINVNYESDDYAYVQDQKAMQMFNVIGCGAGPDISNYNTGTANKTLYQYTPVLSAISPANDIEKQYIYFKLSPDFPYASTADHEMIKAELNKNYINNASNIYWRFYIDLTGNGDFEYVNGYADIDDYGVVTNLDNNGKASVGFIKIKLEHVQLSDVNPISKTAWEFTRLNLPFKIYTGSDPRAEQDGGIVAVIKAIAGFAMNVKSMLTGFYNTMKSGGFASKFEPGKSFIRLCNPTMTKYGGGARVKQITMNDNWHSGMNGSGSDYSYGQTYTYTTVENGRTISSGVAEYEPMLGNDENPLHQPVLYSHSNILAPDDKYIFETPFGESHFPSPNVVYSEVRVQNLARTDNSGNVYRRTATGYSVHKFYTAKDYPVFTYQTRIDAVHDPSNQFLSSLFKFDQTSYERASQGYSIELNDMHGKPKSERVYAEPGPGNSTGALISGVDYKYQTTMQDGKQCLDNSVAVIKKDGTTSTAEIGKDMDFSVDTRSSEDHTYSYTADVNLEAFLIAFFPAAIPTLFPGYESIHKKFNSAVATKIVHRYGILSETDILDENSVTVNKNLAYDPETGEVLLTETHNEYKDPVYNFTYPAHWAYTTMAPAYQTTGMVFKEIYTNNGFINFGAYSSSASSTDQYIDQFLTDGDEVLIRYYDPSSAVVQSAWAPASVPDVTTILGKYWVRKVPPCSTSVTTYPGYTVLIDRDGKIIDDLLTGYDITFWGSTQHTGRYYSMEIIRSGRKNEQTMPVGTVTTMQNPLYTLVNGRINFNNTYVLNASATEYCNYWPIFACWQRNDFNSGFTEDCNEFTPGAIVNPFTAGLIGNNRAKATYTYMADRISTGDISTANRDKTNTRLDGTFLLAKQFWCFTGNMISSAHKGDNWKYTAKVTKFSPYGTELENQDPLGIYSSAVYGYDNLLPIAVAKNAANSDIAFDGFEDYSYYDNWKVCKPSPHFGFLNDYISTLPTSPANDRLRTDIKHSGLYSLWVPVGHHSDVYYKLSPNSCGSNCGSTVYHLQKEDLMGRFSPEPGKYLFSCWIKIPAQKQYAGYFGAQAEVVFNNSSNATVTVGGNTAMLPTGLIIDGWQKVEGVFAVPDASSGATGIRIKLENTGTNEVYFDDVRIEPFNAEMKTYVYDPKSQKLFAELDENNYATFYEYDLEGNLVRVKKETTNGVVTLKETRQNMAKKY